MTTADPKLETIERVKSRIKTTLDNQQWTLDNEAGVQRLKNAVIVGEKERGNGCFSAAVSVLALVAAAVAVLS